MKPILFLLIAFLFSHCCTLPTKDEIKESQKEYTEKVEEQKTLIRHVRESIESGECTPQTAETLDEIENISIELKEKNKECIKNQLTCTNELKEEKEGFWYWIGGAIAFGFVLQGLLKFAINILIKTLRGGL
jgi:hypothetical protein